MRLVFIAGALDHINLPLCNAFYSILEENFRFVSTREKAGLRKDMGYNVYNELYPYVLKWYNIEEKEDIKKIINNADVVIYGSAPEETVSKRMKSGKITFRAAERMYKNGPFTVKNFMHRIIGAYLHHGIYQGKQVYYLCSGAYVANDLNIYNYYKNRCYKWGYFTKLSGKSCEELINIKNNNKITEIVWTARFVSLKHPEIVVNLAEYLKNLGDNFKINMIGNGECLNDTKELANKNNVSEYINFTGSVSPDEVIKYMEKANISLFTSDRGEGWGAVVNEAMGCACAVVASSNAGSSPFLIDDKNNGYLFDINKSKKMFEIVHDLINNKNKIETIGKQAYNDIQKYWTAENAAKSFIDLAESILKGKPEPKSIGPCSIAPLLEDGWYKTDK